LKSEGALPRAYFKNGGSTGLQPGEKRAVGWAALAAVDARTASSGAKARLRGVLEFTGLKAGASTGSAKKSVFETRSSQLPNYAIAELPNYVNLRWLGLNT
jgi:hypothetical protein